MGWLFDLNRSYTGGADATGGLLYHLKRMLVSAGWTVRASGDGLSAVEFAEQNGTGDTITAGAPATLDDAGGAFSTAMVGGTITIAGATAGANNGTFPITAVNSPTQLEYTNGAAVTVTESFTYSIATAGAGTGDGGAYDVITQESNWGGGSAGDMGNERAWFCIREPGGTREFIWQRDQTFQSFGQGEVDVSIKHSPTGFVLGGYGPVSALVPPTASDEFIFWGNFNPPNGAPQGDGAAYGRASINHIIVSDSAVNGVYPWFFIRVQPGASNIEVVQIYDAVTGGQAGDQQPWVWITGADAFIGNYNNNLRHWRDYGGGSEAQSFASMVGMKDSNNDQMVPANTPVQDDGDARDWPIPVWDQTNNQFRGFLSSLRWKGSATRLYPDTQDLATANAQLYVGDLLFPWEQNTVPNP